MTLDQTDALWMELKEGLISKKGWTEEKPDHLIKHYNTIYGKRYDQIIFYKSQSLGTDTYGNGREISLQTQCDVNFCNANCHWEWKINVEESFFKRFRCSAYYTTQEWKSSWLEKFRMDFADRVSEAKRERKKERGLFRKYNM